MPVAFPSFFSSSDSSLLEINHGRSASGVRGIHMDWSKEAVDDLLESTVIPTGDQPVKPVTDDDEGDDLEFNVVNDDSDDSGPLEITEAAKGQNEARDDAGEADEFEVKSGDEDLEDIRSTQIRDRIMRERRIREREMGERLKAEEQYQDMLLNAEKQKLQIQRDSFKMALDSVDLRIRTAREAMKAAQLEGDQSTAIDLQAELEEARKARSDIEQMARQLPTEQLLEQNFAQYRSQRRQELSNALRQSIPDEGSSEVNGVRANNPLAEKWAKNNRWLSSPKYEPHRSYMITVNNKLADEGIDPNDPRFFTELTRRVAKAFPTLDVKDLEGRSVNKKPPAAKKSSAPPVASARAGMVNTNAQQAKPRKAADVPFTADDRRMMRVFGFDPSNKEQRNNWLQEKYSRLKAEGAL